ncbi:peptidase [Planomonospora parontospora subsp. parontospora]|uniref:Peptidase n=2 Tax=Planomonospora parontospora TaxID=58119 RepID=A0AA37BG29_9ACTN|nr:PepSY-associated TM helix domain-containing protein [Planomonospora parontospora]GGK67233.1 peptidase [Planomonospora parontospora]GII08599.1 peptidase [Planomonospora parontospora subsp. parontospora]
MTSDVRELSPAPERPRPAAWPAVRALLLRLHFYAGVLVAPFLLVAATTGLLYAASFQIEKTVHSHELTAPVPAGQTMLPLARQIAAARTAHPEGTVGAVRPAAEPGATTQVLLDAPGLPESTRLAVFVDPYTGEVRGTLESYGSSGALPVRAWISTFHRHLQLGEPGRLYSELAASWLWAVALGGVVLWSSHRRRALKPDRKAGGLRRTLSWHGSVGLWITVGLLFLSATGLTWSAYAGANVDRLQTALGWTTPALPAAAGDHSGHAGHGAGGDGSASGADADRIVAAAAGAGLSGPLEVAWPAEPGAAFTVKEMDREWPQRNDQVAVDAATGRVTGELRFDDFPLVAKLIRWGIDGHMGVLFGLPNQILLMALAAGLICMIVWGYRMWWQRRPTRGFAAPYARGAWRAVPLPVLLPVGLAAIAVGVFVPLLGISLLAFLAVDAVLGRVRAARAATAPARQSDPPA